MDTPDLQDPLSYDFFPSPGLDDAPVVVLLHGLGSSRLDWPLQISALSAHYSVLSIDLPGHGCSAALQGWPDVGAYGVGVGDVLRKLEIAQAHIIGLSLGGMVALQMGLETPSVVRSLVLVNSCAHLQMQAKGFLRSLVRLALLLTGRMKLLGDWVAGGLFPLPDQAALRQMASAHIAQTSRKAYMQAIWALARFDARDELESIAVPTLVIAGEQDATVPLPHKLELAEKIPGAKLCVFPGSGHATPYDAHEAFNDAVLRFLRSVDGLCSR